MVTPLVVEAHGVLKRLLFDVPPEAGTGIARLRFRCHGSHLRETEAQGGHRADQLRVLVETGRQPHGIGEGASEKLLTQTRIVDEILFDPRIEELGQSLADLERSCDQMVCRFRVETEKKGFDLFVIHKKGLSSRLKLGLIIQKKFQIKL